MTNLHKHLEGLYKLHLASVALQHAVRKERDDWAVFEPSQFIYAFFTFNTLYTINWSETRRAERVIEWYQRDNEYEDKIKNVLVFCLSADNGNTYVTNLIRELRREAPIRSILDRIKPDDQIGKRLISKFKTPIVRIIDDGDNNVTMDEYESIFKFIYMVRNNVFHGQKTTLEMLDPDQRHRFSIYTKILTSFNYTLLTYASECGMWSKQGDGQYLG